MLYLMCCYFLPTYSCNFFILVVFNTFSECRINFFKRCCFQNAKLTIFVTNSQMVTILRKRNRCWFFCHHIWGNLIYLPANSKHVKLVTLAIFLSFWNYAYNVLRWTPLHMSTFKFHLKLMIRLKHRLFISQHFLILHLKNSNLNLKQNR